MIHRHSDPGPILEPFTGIVTGRYGTDGDTVADPDYADRIGYIATLNLPEGAIEGVRIGRPNCEAWPRPLKVHPIRAGRGFVGVRVNNVLQWWAMEIPNFGVCTP